MSTKRLPWIRCEAGAHALRIHTVSRNGGLEWSHCCSAVAAVPWDRWEISAELEPERYGYRDSIYPSEKFLGIFLVDWEFGRDPEPELEPWTLYIRLINSLVHPPGLNVTDLLWAAKWVPAGNGIIAPGRQRKFTALGTCSASLFPSLPVWAFQAFKKKLIYMSSMVRIGSREQPFFFVPTHCIWT